jgi:hypothetical protein
MKLQMRTLIAGAGVSLLVFSGLSMPLQVCGQSTASIRLKADSTLEYLPDEQGNTIPNFSRVGYHQGDRLIPDVPVRIEVTPSDDDQRTIQAAIDRVSRLPRDSRGLRGAVLLLPGTYRIPGTLRIDSSGVVLRGSGSDTRLVATGNRQRSLIIVAGSGSPREVKGTRTRIKEPFTPTGSYALKLEDVRSFKPGDEVILQVDAIDKWVRDLKMDRIEEREGTQQWDAAGYRFPFQRRIMKIDGDQVILDNPVMMALDDRYFNSSLYRFTFSGRISESGVEYMTCISEFSSDTAEDHGWLAVEMDRIENGWVRGVHAVHFGLGCVALRGQAKQVTVVDCSARDPKSIITGGRRYSFSIDGQQNLVTRCYSREARHDYATGSRVCGPNVFSDCIAERSHSDVGPHHRWTIGTLYDQIRTDNELNVQDRGNWGSGHGWAGVTQVIWNCEAKTLICQDPWISGRNYLIGGSYKRLDGRLKGRPQTPAEFPELTGRLPASLYQAQFRERSSSVSSR